MGNIKSLRSMGLKKREDTAVAPDARRGAVILFQCVAHLAILAVHQLDAQLFEVVADTV
jgi:hypothetical protein